MRHANHVTSEQTVAKALRNGAGDVAIEAPTHSRDRIKIDLRLRTRSHHRAFRQLQDFVSEQAAEFGIVTVLPDPVCTNKRYAQWVKSDRG
ncbi:MAG TPA: hypothetical protein VGJ20_14125 [Xanthobacteraceae bacterium]